MSRDWSKAVRPDRPDPLPLTPVEKAAFDTIKNKARGSRDRDLHLSRMLLDGKQVAVVMCDVRNAITGQSEGAMPLAVLLDDDTASRLRTIHGEAPDSVDPFALE